MRKKIVILGMMTKMPVAGNVWLVLHYMLGFQRLGYEPYYVEAHGRTPSMFMQKEDDDGTGMAARFIDKVMRLIDLNQNWAYHALHDDGSVHGMTELQLKELYASADLIINLHGGTVPLPEHYETGRLVYLETDPVELEIELYNNDRLAIEFLEPHCAFFTWGENYGNPDCKVPVPEQFKFVPTRAPVVLDLWQHHSDREGELFTTIGNWAQAWRDVVFQNEVYHWSKHFEFLKFLDLPQRTSQGFELALSSYQPADKAMLEEKGWRVRHAMGFSTDLDAYRSYIRESRGEFTVAKDQNVRLRSGWFSERSAQYLAAGRPVITQDTGFGSALPTGEGLFGFSTMDDILLAVDAVNSDYSRHCRAAKAIARDYFNYDVVLKQFLDELGM